MAVLPPQFHPTQFLAFYDATEFGTGEL